MPSTLPKVYFTRTSRIGSPKYDPNEAFAKLPENKAKLTRMITFHVVPGLVLAKDVVKLHCAETVAGAPLKIDAYSGVKVNDANVVKPDIRTSNGVIHVIDNVLMPPAE